MERGGPLLAVLKCDSGVLKRKSEREDGKIEDQLISEKLPRGAVLAYNKNVAGVYGDIFYQ